MADVNAQDGPTSRRYRISADIGGTFTDVVVQDRHTGAYRAAKALTTPGSLADGIIAAFDQLLPDLSEVEFAVHGTTQGLNALLSRTGDRVLLLTTRGVRDSYFIMRGSRPREEMYNNRYRRPEPLIRRRDAMEIGGRLDWSGAEVEPVSRADVEAAAAYARSEGIASIAVCLLFSYANPAHEQAVGRMLEELLPGISLSLSHEVAREWREAERTASTLADAYISRIVRQYLASIQARLAARKLVPPLQVTRSSGGVMSITQAIRRPIQTLFSGPVGGTTGAAALVEAIGNPRLICADVGGTSFDVSLVIDGLPRTSNQTTLSGMDIIMPLVDIYSIGAGGGSLAYVEAGGLRVGPRSAGARPGPAAYGRGGTEATVTDAQVYLNRFLPPTVGGGGLVIDRAKAEAALGALAARIGMDVTALAEGIIDISNAKMAEAIRRITVEQGIEPRDFSIVAFGGAGPMHAAFLAQALEIREVIVPPMSGVFSAWGMLHAPLRHDIAQSWYASLSEFDGSALVGAYSGLEAEAVAHSREEAGWGNALNFQRLLDLRYDGQEYTLTVDVTGIALSDAQAIGEAFHAAYHQRYGHAHRGTPVEIVTLRLVASGEAAPVRADATDAAEGAPPFREREVSFAGRWLPTRIYEGASLRPGHRFSGPAIIDNGTATTIVPPGAEIAVEARGLLRMTLPA